jgi:hypothetical protein
MKLTDQIHLKGEVLIQTITLNGEITTVVDDRNLIVSYGRNNICNFLSNTGTSSYIYDIAFGRGGTVSGNADVAKPVLPEDTTLNIRIPAEKAVDYTFTGTPETSPSPRIVFSAVVPVVSPSLNGFSISELALMLNTSPDPLAFAIKRFPAISKSDTISLLITWIIYL